MATRPPDFKSSGIRVERIIASGSSTNPRLLLIGSGATGNDGVTVDTSNLRLFGTGSDTWLFISGAVGGTDRVTFGGDVHISGSLTGVSVSSTPAGSNTQVQFNDVGSFGGDAGLVYAKSTQTLTVGNLTITGTLTSISSSQVRIVDPVIILGSGSTGVNSNGGIAIASGSNTSAQSLVWGRVAINTWGSGRLDVQDGATSNLTTMTLANVRAAKFEAGGSGTGANYISSSANSNLLIGAQTQVLVMSGGGSTSPNPAEFSDVNFFVSGSSDGSAISLFGGNATVSGTLRVKNTLGSVTGYISQGGEISGSGGLLVGGSALIGINTHVSGNLSVGVSLTTTGTQRFGALASADVGVDSFHHVSGTIDLINAAAKKSIFGGDSVFSGSLFLVKRSSVSIPPTISGQGSLYVKNTDGLIYFKDETGTEHSLIGGGGSGTEWVDRGDSLVTTSSVSIAGKLGDTYEASSAGANVYFFVSGSESGGSDALFGGNVITSGTILVKDSGGGSQIRLSKSDGNISGSGDILAGGSATLGGDLTVNGGDILTTASAATIFSTNATSISMGNGTTSVSIGNSAVGTAHTFTVASSRTGNVTINLANGTAAGGSTKNINIGQGGVAGSTTNIRLGTTDEAGTTNIFISGSMQMTGSVDIRGSIVPNADFTYNLGTPTLRWQNVYTGDLHLRNSRGDWTILEEEEYLCVINNKTGKRYKMMLQPLD
jgi:hypothetical protein